MKVIAATALLLLLPVGADEFAVSPRLCVQHAGQDCVLHLTINWQQPQPVCLYQQTAPDTPLLCQQSAQQIKLALPLQQDTVLLLKDQASGKLLAQRQLRLLRVDLQSGEHLLNKSRNGWWLLQ